MKNIAIIAHDHKKSDLVKWLRLNQKSFKGRSLFATGTTGSIVEKELGIEVQKFKSGPLGGDQQIGALISEGKIDVLIFFWDPLEPLPHDPDVKALLRLAALWNIPVACNMATADFLITSPHFDGGYEAQTPDFSRHYHRQIPHED